jgi:hypothetical protein
MSEKYVQLIDPYWQKGPGNPFENPMDSMIPTRTGASIGAASDLLETIERFADMQEAYKKVGEGLGIMNIENQVKSQLSLGQSVTLVLQKNEKGQFKVDSIERPGKSYLTEPESATKIDNVSKTDTSGVCYVPGREPAPKETFKISDSAGKDRELHLDGNSMNNTKEATANAPAQGDQSAASKIASPLTASPPPAEAPKGPVDNQSTSTSDDGDSGGDGF